VFVVHTAENTPDFVAFDGGAEAVARFIRTRPGPGSYHDLADSDSTMNLIRYGCEAYHDGTGSNPHSLSVSIATRADVWPLAPQKWRDGAIEQAARAAARQATWLKQQTGIVVPARRITRAESERKVPGFISHAQRDPRRRSDPGDDFPWTQFLDRYRSLMGGTPPKPPAPKPPAPPTEDQMFTLFFIEETGKYQAMTPWGVSELTAEEGYLIDAGSTGLTAVKVKTTATWNKIKKNAPS
jgi:hypothetical protein